MKVPHPDMALALLPPAVELLRSLRGWRAGPGGPG